MILDEIVKDKRARLIVQKQDISEAKMKEMALTSTRESISFYDALAKDGLSIIGEFKKASPSMGLIQSKINLEDR
ncbi:MAG: indole-3-glycerol phosphate synthase, partial [Clostridium sp.]|nr:indole-3-glycerol phosphate synthase [Clostridium sp.]